MTAPQEQAASTTPPQIQQHDAAALALETAAVLATATVVRRQVNAALAAALRPWKRVYRGDTRTRQSGPQFRQITTDLSRRLRAIHIDPGPVLLEYAKQARVLGVEQGFAEADEAPFHIPTTVDLQTHITVSKAVAEAKAKLAESPKMLDTLPAGSFRTVEAATAPAQQAANVIERTANEVVNTELNSGITDLADRLGAQRVWIAERNACVVCLALSGQVVDTGHPFDLAATFGAKPMAYVPISAGGLTGPPRHPWCRCRSSIWRGANDNSVLDFPSALRREAERSILRGDALPSESERVRTQAADRLLAAVSNGVTPSGWLVPKSVRTKAQAAVDRGHFNRK